MTTKYDFEARTKALKNLRAEIDTLNRYYPNRPSDIDSVSANQALNYYIRACNREGLRNLFLSRESEISPSHVSHYLKGLIDPSYSEDYKHSGIGQLLFHFLISND